jgi:hypothetical protein
VNPYLDLPGFFRRTIMAQGELNYIETDSPGWLVQRIAMRSSLMNGFLRKRYGNAGNGRNSLPFGQNAPPLTGPEASPPIGTKGRPTLGSQELVVQVTAGNTFKWSVDGGINFTTNVPIAPSVVLGSSGVTLSLSTSPYNVGDVYEAPTPVPSIILVWLVNMVTYDAYRKRGMNPSDPNGELIVQEFKDTITDLKEAANSKDGLFDLPSNEDADSAVTTGGPLGYSEQSPYVWTDIQACAGRGEDINGTGEGD